MEEADDLTEEMWLKHYHILSSQLVQRVHSVRMLLGSQPLCCGEAQAIKTERRRERDTQRETERDGRKRKRTRRANEVQPVARVNHQKLEWKTL